MSILDKLNHLNDTKDLIRQAIIAKGISVSESDTFRSYAEKIAAISTGGSGGEITGTTPKTVTLAEACEAGDIVFVVRKSLIDPNAVNYPIKTADILGTSPAPYDNCSAINATSGIRLSGDGNFLVGNSRWTAPYHHVFKWSEANNRYEQVSAINDTSMSIGLDYAMSYDGTYLVVGGGSSPYLQTFKWNAGNNRYEKTNDPDTLPTAFCCACKLSSDGSKLVIYCNTSPYLWSYKWNETNQRYEKTANVDNAPFGPYSGKILFTGSSDLSKLLVGYSSTYKFAFLWNETNNRYERGNATVCWSGHTNNADSRFGAMSGDGSVVLLGGQDEGLGIVKWNNTNNRFEPISGYESGLRPPAQAYNYPNPNDQLYGAHGDISSDGSMIVVGVGCREPFFMVYKFNGTTGFYEATRYPDISPGYPVRRITVSDNGGKIAVLRSNHPGNGLYMFTYKNDEIANLAAYKQTSFANKPMPDNCYAVGFLNESGSKGDSVSMSCLWIKQDVF